MRREAGQYFDLLNLSSIKPNQHYRMICCCFVRHVSVVFSFFSISKDFRKAHFSGYFLLLFFSSISHSRRSKKFDTENTLFLLKLVYPESSLSYLYILWSDLYLQYKSFLCLAVCYTENKTELIPPANQILITLSYFVFGECV